MMPPTAGTDERPELNDGGIDAMYRARTPMPDVRARSFKAAEHKRGSRPCGERRLERVRPAVRLSRYRPRDSQGRQRESAANDRREASGTKADEPLAAARRFARMFMRSATAIASPSTSTGWPPERSPPPRSTTEGARRASQYASAVPAMPAPEIRILMSDPLPEAGHDRRGQVLRPRFGDVPRPQIRDVAEADTGIRIGETDRSS